MFCEARGHLFKIVPNDLLTRSMICFKLFLPFLSNTRARSRFGLGVRLRIGELSRDRTVLFFKSEGIRPTDDRRLGLGGRSSGPINGESFLLVGNCGDGDRSENGESHPLEGDKGVGDRQTNGAWLNGIGGFASWYFLSKLLEIFPLIWFKLFILRPLVCVGCFSTII